MRSLKSSRARDELCYDRNDTKEAETHVRLERVQMIQGKSPRTRVDAAALECAHVIKAQRQARARYRNTRSNFPAFRTQAYRCVVGSELTLSHSSLYLIAHLLPTHCPSSIPLSTTTAAALQRGLEKSNKRPVHHGPWRRRRRQHKQSRRRCTLQGCCCKRWCRRRARQS